MRDGRIFKPRAQGCPQEKEVLLEIERAFERLVAMEEWLEGSQKKGVEDHVHFQNGAVGFG
jgi:hypothetical protein